MARAAGIIEHVENPQQDHAGGPIDRAHLVRQCLGDANLEIEVLRLFDETIARHMARLSAPGEVEELRMALHMVRGAATGIGAFGVADTARQAEEALRGSGTVGAEHIEDLAMAVEEVRGYIAARVAEAGE